MTVAGVLSEQGESDDGLSAASAYGFYLFCQICFEGICFQVHLAGSDFFLGGSVIAQFADAEAIF